MCKTCGCSDDAKTTMTSLQTGISSAISHNDHEHSRSESHEHQHTHVDENGHTHTHSHSHSHTETRGHAHSQVESASHSQSHAHSVTIKLEESILAKNDLLAAKNRDWLVKRNIVALNLVSAPGSGKTTLLERTITDLKGAVSVSVIEGDQETINDAERIKATGCNVIQLNTGSGCHLEAAMVARALDELQPANDSLLFIENVGNLVCPALFDLGEVAKVVILSATEGDDKPLKYPHMFRASNVMIVNKIDLLPYVRFDTDACIAHARAVNPKLTIFQVSATSGQGLQGWYDWLRQQITAPVTNSPPPTR